VAQLRIEVLERRACDLWQRATQAVFGEGPEGAKVMLVGEQPGDMEDRRAAIEDGRCLQSPRR
jgi:uracil-DNA glycosylase family 4